MTGPAAALQFLRRRPVGFTIGAVLALIVVVTWIGKSGGGSRASAAQAPTPVALPATLFPSPSPQVVDPEESVPPTTAPVPARQPPAIIGPDVAPLTKRFDPDVFIRTTKPVTLGTVRELLARTGGNAELVATGGVGLGTGTTTAVGVDPSSFRRVTPAATAASTPLWQSVAKGNVAVAHAVAKALAVGLGDDTTVASKGQEAYDFRVGAYATTGLPGVGVVIDEAYDSLLDLVPNTGIVISASGRDPAIVAALAQQFLGTDDPKGVEATALRIATNASGKGLWVAPAGGPITSGYGYRVNPYSGAPSEFHAGIDIGAPYGAPIYAASAGVVSYAGPASGFGNEVILSHPGGVSTVYGHMEKILVAAGQPVNAGQPIALVGSEGDSTGAHLHFEVHLGDTTTDPLPWLISHGVDVHH